MAYIGKSPTGSGVRQRYVYTATGGETSLSGADDNSKTLKFTDGEYVDVHLNGVLLVQGTDYGVGTANTISSLAALAANDVVEITVYDVYNVAKINSEAMRNRWYFTATGGETSITTTEVPGLSFNANAEIEVRLNGVSLQQGVDFNTTTANQVGGLAALTAGQVVEIIHYADFQLADTVSKAAGGTYTGQVIADGGIDMNGKELILDADGDSKIEAGTDDTVTFSNAGSETMRIDSSGNLGIGTTSPTFGSGSGLEISRSGTSTLRVERTGSTASSGEFFAGNDKVAIGSTSNTHLEFRVNSVERMRIQSGGGVSIGQTDGNGKLNIQSSGLLNRWHNDGGTSGYFTIASIRNNAGSGEVGSIVRVNDASVAYNTSSDHRLKENVEDMTGAITRVKNLQPKRFNFISDTTDTLVDGFMAHEAATVVPESVTGTHNEVDEDGNPVYQGIDQAKLVPLLTGALQEAITKIETLETEMTALKARVTTLENA